MKSLFSKGINKERVALAAIWGTVIITGFLALVAIVGGVESLLVFSGVHGLTARIGLGYSAVYIFRNRSQIMERIRVKLGRSNNADKMGIGSQSPKTPICIKVIFAIVFHIILHIISIHLAVAYTIFHIVQHRHMCSTLCKNLAFRCRNNGKQVAIPITA
jgi:hypothetical protein